MRGAPVFAHTRLREGFCETFVRRKPLLLVTAPNDEHRVNVRKSWRSSSNHTEGYVLFQWIQKRATQREMLCEEKYKSYFYLLSMDNILSPSLNIVRHWSFAIDFLASFFPTHCSRVNKTIFWPMTEKKKNCYRRRDTGEREQPCDRTSVFISLDGYRVAMDTIDSKVD